MGTYAQQTPSLICEVPDLLLGLTQTVLQTLDVPVSGGGSVRVGGQPASQPPSWPALPKIHSLVAARNYDS